ncbi:unnamed protein product [Symbiodinium sp. CCMP2592]|nr:unnamed protein product [Symbiodinium sp. CCMP2592]
MQTSSTLERLTSTMHVAKVFVTAATPDGFVYHRSVSDMFRPQPDSSMNSATVLETEFSALGFSNLVRCLSSGPLDADLSSGVSRPSPKQVLDLVLLPLCREFGVPLSLRMGTARAVAPSLGLAGDGVGAAELRSLGHLCEANPQVKFLFTVLSRTDQHEAAVLATKFRNLHLWGCWWYCNYPSVVSEVTSLRLEMLGTKFTFQASSARVHDQLIYKWIHARSMLSKLLVHKYTELMATGYRVSRGDLRRDVGRLLGGSFEEFLQKKL